MNRKALSTILSVALVGGVAAGVGISHAANTATTKTSPKPTAAAQTTAPKTVAKVKLSQDDATKIAMKAHKDGKVLNVKLENKLYVVNLQTPKGNVTMKIGANTGRIFSDTLIASKTSTPAKVPAVDTKTAQTKTDDTKTNDAKVTTDTKANDGKTTNTKTDAAGTGSTDTKTNTAGSTATDKK